MLQKSCFSHIDDRYLANCDNANSEESNTKKMRNEGAGRREGRQRKQEREREEGKEREGRRVWGVSI